MLWPKSDTHSHCWHWCGLGCVFHKSTTSWMWTVASIPHLQELWLSGSLPNSCVPFQCSMLWQAGTLWTCKEGIMVNMEITARTDSCTTDAGKWIIGDPRWFSEHYWEVCHISLTDPALIPRRRMWEGCSFHWHNRCSESCLVELRWWGGQESSLLGWSYLEKDFLLPSPTDWGGWRQKKWTLLPQASQSCHELIADCGCKKNMQKVKIRGTTQKAAKIIIRY